MKRTTSKIQTSIERTNSVSISTVHDAAKKQDWKFVLSNFGKLFTSENIDMPDDQGYNLLWYAVHQENIEMVEFLLQRGAKANAPYNGSYNLFSYNLFNCGPTELSYLLFKNDNQVIIEKDRSLIDGGSPSDMSSAMIDYLNSLLPLESNDSNDNSPEPRSFQMTWKVKEEVSTMGLDGSD